jgi:serine/threonine protein kinase
VMRDREAPADDASDEEVDSSAATRRGVALAPVELSPAELPAPAELPTPAEYASSLAADSAAADASTAVASPAAVASAERREQDERAVRAALNAPVPDEAFVPGARFDGYVLGKCIGHGGMAHIFQAEHEGLRRQVALKALGAMFARDAEGRERFLREARIAAAIKHPNVVNLFDVGVYAETPYLVMELLEGADLDALLEPKKPLPEDTLLDIMIPVVAGLAAVHDAGVVHRDLKPGNIYLARGARGEIVPKLLDFGISKSMGSEQLKVTSANGLLMGTPAYMSPEALRGEEMTPASDQYSFGIVLYECATGVNPFAVSTFAETVRLITSGEFPRPSTHNPALSRRLESIIERALSLEPEDRFADVRELGRELLSLAGQRTRLTWGLSFGDTASLAAPELTRKLTARLTHVRDTQSQSRTRPQRRRLHNALAVAIPLALLATGLVRWSGGDAPASSVSTLGAAPLVGENLEPAPAGLDVARMALAPAPKLPDPVIEELGDFAKALEGATGGAIAASAPAAEAKEASTPVRAAPPVAASTRAAVPAPRASAARPDTRADDKEGRPAKRPWWLPEPERKSKPARPGPNGVGANNAPIFD